jgi:hypothetical protein
MWLVYKVEFVCPTAKFAHLRQFMLSLNNEACFSFYSAVVTGPARRRSPAGLAGQHRERDQDRPSVRPAVVIVDWPVAGQFCPPRRGFACRPART